MVQERARKKAESFLVESSKAQGGQPGSWYNKSNRGEYRKEWQCAESERKDEGARLWRELKVRSKNLKINAAAEGNE